MEKKVDGTEMLLEDAITKANALYDVAVKLAKEERDNAIISAHQKYIESLPKGERIRD